MPKDKIIWLAITSAFVVSIHPAGAQGEAASGLYRIVLGTYTECCGIAGDFTSSLPNESQGFIKLTVDPQTHFATMKFLSADSRTVFSVFPCPPGDAINFHFNFGFARANGIEFHVDPGPPPYAVYWNYAVSNSTDRLRIDGTLGMAQVNCADVPNRFTHSKVEAVLVPPPRLSITGVSSNGARLFLQGHAGQTNVIESSTDLVNWVGVSTNVMDYSLCPLCPFAIFEDSASTNLSRRFYRAFELP